jgi:uncharacterized protein YndB with AHSA1/START domain
MPQNLTVKVTTTINASVAKVWDALINPKLIKEYLFGVDAISDWKEGSKIIYKGVWEGKEFEDKGIIEKMIPEKLFATKYWSGFSGTEDKIENYCNVIYELESKGDETILSVSQDKITDETTLQHVKENWETVLEGIKKILEK